jgi:hypothetical protein
LSRAAAPHSSSLAFGGPEDWDMLIRVSRHGHLVFCNDVILRYRMHGENLGSRPLGRTSGVARALQGLPLAREHGHAEGYRTARLARVPTRDDA